MADARALLRAERAARKITHPHASYTADGKLLCNLCETPVKSEAHWQSHLHSTKHNLRSQRRQDVAASRGAGDGGGKKRKAESSEDEREGEGRKKVRADNGAELRARSKVAEYSAEEETTENEAKKPKPSNGKFEPEPPTQPAKPPDSNINADDILAFERELEQLEAEATREEQQARSHAASAATISAAPLTAEEVAAQAREEQSKQRGRRDEELEGEREDAARVFEEEMDEMEGLESRLKVLRERRERLSGKSEGLEPEGRKTDEAGDGDDGGRGSEKVNGEQEAGEEGSDEDENEDDDDDDEDPDEWKFGGS